MNIATEYLHTLEGRIRIKVPEIKGSPTKAGELEQQVQWQSGIHSIKANPTTGNVLIYYDPRTTQQKDIFRTFCEFGYLQPIAPQAGQSRESSEESPSLINLMVTTVAQSMMEAALTRLVTAII